MKQACIPSLLLFALVIDCVMKNALAGLDVSLTWTLLLPIPLPFGWTNVQRQGPDVTKG